MFCRHRYKLAQVETKHDNYRGVTTYLNGYCVICGKGKSKYYSFDISDNDVLGILAAIGWLPSGEFPHLRFES